MINPSKLMSELVSAGLPVCGVASTGRIDWTTEPTQQQLTQAQAIVSAHNPATWVLDKDHVFGEIESATIIISGGQPNEIVSMSIGGVVSQIELDKNGECEVGIAPPLPRTIIQIVGLGKTMEVYAA